MPSDSGQDLLVLDTHVWVSATAEGKSALRPEAAAAIERAGRAGRLGVSAISVWEVCMLDEKGRLRLIPDRLEWVRRALTAPGLSLLPLSPEVAAESTRLPGDFHGDPADRIIIATARVNAGTLLTKDRRLLAYAKAGYVKAMAV
jgi:PIN domain nuclease of toxin-antitoxin system